ncbi:MAG: flavoprotein [Pseudonocardiaceae bacterium]
MSRFPLGAFLSCIEQGVAEIHPAELALTTAIEDPEAPDVLPPADAMVVAPITCNSLAKGATGISDTLPLGLLVEAVGKRQPVVSMPVQQPSTDQFPGHPGRHRQADSLGGDRLGRRRHLQAARARHRR